MIAFTEKTQPDMKIVVLGSSFVGKTCVITRFISNTYNSKNESTLGAPFSVKTIGVQEKKITLGIWDTAGQERFESISKMYYRKANAAIICYDVMDMESYEKLEFWVNEVQTIEKNSKLYLCGTKIDLVDEINKRIVPLNKIKKYASELGVEYIETSSKKNINIDQLFTIIGKEFLNEKELEEEKSRENKSIKKEQRKKKKKAFKLKNESNETNEDVEKGNNKKCC
ncbi:ras-related protein rab-24 [Anaeramoeba flamelloides]|uniref:Ras-related protein rab-24 n=1 Tax=Anaeramoeba flamelloides TaxID=1746091 RepID=A0AAV7YQ57_9EUKA|nr:ras-related protein rab-24 [Anaeramoeba flamelloides]KAJ6253941.1 ras-related protein rab-24 [Anaeramoeba flamelloides]